MTEAELLTKVATAGWTIIESKTLGAEGTGDNLLTVKALLLVKPEGDAYLRQWENYYQRVDGKCAWREHDPFRVAPVDFSQQVRNKISNPVAAGTIKAGYLERVDINSETALAVVIKPDDSLAMYHVCKVGGEPQITPITGSYPI